MKNISNVTIIIVYVFKVNQVYNQKVKFYITNDFHNL